jgi:quercetin dioxygenase-like cupin family protein
MTKHPVLETREQATRFERDGGSISVRLRSEQTDGELGAMEMVLPAGFGGLPLHVHPAFDELFFVLEGEITFRVGDVVRAAPAGSVVYAPGAVPHTFAELNRAPARFLLVFNPAGHERYFEQMAAALESSANGIPSPELYQQLMAEHGITPLGSADPRDPLPATV